MESKRLSGKNITIMVVAVCMAVVSMPAAVYASTGSFINITDPITAAYKARVSAKGSLVVSPRDAVSGYNAKIDSLGRQQVAGTVMTVASGGTQAVSGTISTQQLPSNGAVSASSSFVPASNPDSLTIVLPAGKSFALTDVVLADMDTTYSSSVRVKVFTPTTPTCGSNAGSYIGTDGATLIGLTTTAGATQSASLQTPVLVPATSTFRCIFADTTEGPNGIMITMSGYVR